MAGLNHAQREVSKFNTSIMRSSNGMTAFGVSAGGLTGILMGLAAGAKALMDSGVDEAAKWERSTVALEAMGATAEQSTAMMNKMAEMAQASPIDLDGARRGTQRLMAFGFAADEATGIMERLVNVAASAPGDATLAMDRLTLALGQMRGKGRVMTQELNQLTEAGMGDIWPAIAKRMGVARSELPKLLEQGLVPAEVGIRAAIEDIAGGSKFSGLLPKMARTFSGMAQMLQTEFKLGLRDLGFIIMDALDLKGGMAKWTEMIRSARENLESWRPTIMAIGAALTALRDILLQLGSDALKAFKGWAVEGADLATIIDDVRTKTVEMVRDAVKGFMRMVNELKKIGIAFDENVRLPFLQWQNQSGRFFFNEVGVPVGQTNARNRERDLKYLREEEDLANSIVRRRLEINRAIADTNREQGGAIDAWFNRVLGNDRRPPAMAGGAGLGALLMTDAGLARQASQAVFNEMERNSNVIGRVAGSGFIAAFGKEMKHKAPLALNIAGLAGTANAAFEKMVEKMLTPLEKLRVELKRLQVEWNRSPLAANRDVVGAAAGGALAMNLQGIQNDIFGMAMAQEFLDAAKSSKALEFKAPPTLQVGTKEAEEAIVRVQSGGQSMKVEEILKRMEQTEKDQKNFLKDIRDQMQKAGLLKVLSAK